MGFSRGSELMETIIKVVHENVDDKEVRILIYEEIAQAIWDMDGDTLDECLDQDPAFDEALNNIGYLDDEYEDIEDDLTDLWED